MSIFNQPKKQSGNVALIVLITLVIVGVTGYAAYRIYTSQEESSQISQSEENEDVVEVSNSSTQEIQQTEYDSINDGALEISGTDIVVTYPKTEWSATNEDSLYDYVLTSNDNFKLSIDVLAPDEGGKGCSDCTYEPIEQTIVLNGKTYYLSVAGGYSSSNNSASNVTLSESPDKLVLPTLLDGSKLFYQLVYFPGSPNVSSIYGEDFQAAIGVMTTISE